MSEREYRKVAIREWTCPHHDEPRVIRGQGYEAEDISVAEEFPKTIELVRALMPLNLGVEMACQVFDAWKELSLCCESAEWRTVGYRMVEVSEFEKLLHSDPLIARLKETFNRRSVLLREFDK